MRGVITRYFASKGYAFLRDEDGHTRFFHAGAVLAPGWDRLREGASVEFVPIAGPDETKLRAERVQMCSN